MNIIKEQREVIWGILPDSNKGISFIQEGDIIVWNGVMDTEKTYPILRPRIIKTAKEAVSSQKNQA